MKVNIVRSITLFNKQHEQTHWGSLRIHKYTPNVHQHLKKLYSVLFSSNRFSFIAFAHARSNTRIRHMPNLEIFEFIKIAYFFR